MGQNTFEKNWLGQMLIEQIIEHEIRRPGSCSRTCILTTGYFHDQAKISKVNL